MWCTNTDKTLDQPCSNVSADALVDSHISAISGDEVLLQQLLLDAVVTAPMEAYWTAMMMDAAG